MKLGLTLPAAVVAALAFAASSASASDWAHFGGDAQVTNDVPTAAAPDYASAGDAAANLQVRWKAGLDGAVIASPLYADGVTIDGGPVNVVYVATQSGSVFALDSSDGEILWQHQLGTVIATCDEPQAGVASTYGVVSTGAINRGRNVIYVIGATGALHALDLATGQEAPGWPVQVVADTSGELVWGGLTMSGDKLYVPV
ncbi:MAG TPA: PQQ-binding-like beta-propeller repeat protein, partial [Gaiellaceae bacterium]|nr:PQQ-binding-like beta-propeller repeat protein [Gaiellaceae bacterium]